MSDEAPIWSETVGMAEAGRCPPDHPLKRRLSPGADQRARIAAALDLEALNRLEADVEVSAWFDGVQIKGRWRAEVTQFCGVSLELFSTALAGAFDIHAVPQGSPLAPAVGAEVIVDPDADDPPDVIEGDRIDLAGYLVEHLALEIDPFARKPGAEFQAQVPDSSFSPFAVLKGFKSNDPDD